MLYRYWGIKSMSRSVEIQHVLNEIGDMLSQQKVLTKKIDVLLYKELTQKIPDRTILIKEVFPHDEVEGIYENYKPYISQFDAFPFLGTLGDAVVCIGFGQANKGKIFYFDFDFGCFCLDQSLDEFLLKLVD